MAADNRIPSPTDVAVGARIKQLRELREISSKMFAAQIGVKYQQLQKYESGENRVSAGRLWEIAKILHTTILYFYEGIDPIPARARRGLAEEASDFSGPMTDQTNELVAAFSHITDEDVRAALVAEVRKQAWAVSRRSAGASRSKS